MDHSNREKGPEWRIHKLSEGTGKSWPPEGKGSWGEKIPKSFTKEKGLAVGNSQGRFDGRQKTKGPSRPQTCPQSKCVRGGKTKEKRSQTGDGRLFGETPKL